MTDPPAIFDPEVPLPTTFPTETSPVTTTKPQPQPPTVTRGKKRAGRSSSPILDAATQNAIHLALPYLQQTFQGLSTVLTTTKDFDDLPQKITPAVLKMLADQPPWIHWNKADMAPMLKTTDKHKLTLIGPLRGYRMARASHGVSEGCWYYECILLKGPSAKEVTNALPSNARLGPGLQQQLQECLAYEHKKQNDLEVDSSGDKPPRIGGQVRVGWSMRTGYLQAPVGYDRWSYGIRSLQGSIIHESQRQDQWGGQGFEPGDVIGCAIFLDETKNIRFFKNGENLGTFEIAKGKRRGGEAFPDIEPGTYYPAVSPYMGGGVKTNFGPVFIYPPRRMPLGIKVQPLSNSVNHPLEPEQAVELAAPAIKHFPPKYQAAVKQAIQTEAEMVYEAYQSYKKSLLEDIRQERLERGLSVADLPNNDELDAPNRSLPQDG